MSRDPSYITALKQLSRQRGDIVDALTQLEYFQRSEDRPAAILVSTHLEDSIQDLILTKMVPLNSTELGEMFSGDRLLGTFSAKIQIAYALGLIGPKTRRDLDLIRLVRNAFAHSRKTIRFATKEVADVCDQLTMLERFPDLSGFGGIVQPIDTPRRRFIATVTLYQMGMFQAEKLFDDEAVIESLGPPIPLD